jgi:cytochrome c2
MQTDPVNNPRQPHHPPDRGPTSWIKTLAWAVAGVGGSVLVSVWALGLPGNDPLGDAAQAAQDVFLTYTTWIATDAISNTPDWQALALVVPQSDPRQGPALMVAYGCGSCHVIPGVAGARGTVGPALTGFADRAYIAGIIGNAPGGLISWLMNPTVHAPQTAMPDLGVSEPDARDMAAYLYTLGGGR